MSTIQIQPMQWASLPELHDVPELDEGDAACLDEVRAVLARHGKLKRFGVNLLHSHFALEPGEVLIERPDPDGRTQHVTVGLLSDEPAARVTSWAFDEGPALHLSDAVYCVCVAVTPNALGTCSVHGKSISPGAAATEDERKKMERISEERSKFEAGFPVAGHDPRERRRGRD